MEFENGFWATYARKCGTTMYRVVKSADKHRGTVYRFLDGDDKRLGKQSKAALAAAFGVSLRTLLRVRAEHLKEIADHP